ncbi:MAG: M13 family metallopeptidase [Pseudomonadota bacterium]|nr:M13 family metallopeptidase [Pseudomonadota bacterium]
MKKIFIISLVGVLFSCSDPQLESGVNKSDFNEDIRPQDSMYDYVNSKWLRETEIPDDQLGWGSYMTLREESFQNQKKLIKELISNGATQESGSEESQIVNLYLSFMDRERVNNLGSEPIQADIERINEITSVDDIWEYFASSVIKGRSTPLYFAVYDDLKNPLDYTIYFGQNGLGLPDRDYYLEDKPHYVTAREEYPKYLENVFILAKLDNVNLRASNAFEVEHNLAQIQLSRIERRDPQKTYNPLNSSELDILTKEKFIIWLRGLKIDGYDRFIIESPSYLLELSELLGTISVEKWRDYLIARLVTGSSGALSDNFVEESFRFSKILTGREELPALWKRGVGLTNSVMGDALGKIYIKSYFPPEYKKRMTDLVNNLLFAFKVGIEELEWMSEETKIKALDKLDKLNVKIGYPEVWDDYEGLELRADDLFGNLKRAAEFEFLEAVEKLTEKVDRKKWAMSPQTVNAYFSPTKNEIVFPAAYLQPPNFIPSADDAVNYGAIGVTIGHEISHAFDDKGSQYDGDGKLNNWWSDQDRRIFDEKTKKLINQYSKYEPVPGININGELTLGENIADLAGAKASFRAYKISLKGNRSPLIDGLTGEQRFFIGSAQSDRVKFRKEIEEMRVATDPHSPARFRIDGVLVNMEEFHQAFNTKEGDKLFRDVEDIIKIW